MSRDLRGYLAELEQSGELVSIGPEVDPRFELAAVLDLLEAGPAVRFEQVTGSPMKVVGNVVSSRARTASALGVAPEGISRVLLEAIAAPMAPRFVEAGACQSVVRPADLTALPVPSFFQQETGPYVTAGVIAVRDVVSGERNLSFARLKVLDATRAMLGVSPNHHLGKMAARAADAGRDLPIAVVLGTHPAIMLAACLYLGFGDDELECAGTLLGAPVDVVRARTSDILVPADAELVLEGVVRPGERIHEGLVSEFHGRYHDYGPGYLVEFSTITHRPDPLFQVILPGLHQEHILLGAVAIAAGLQVKLRELVPGVVEVAVPDTGAGRTSLVVSVRDIQPGQADQLMEVGLSLVSLIKQVVVVDAAVDPWNAEAVEWARLWHARPERDYRILRDRRTDRSDALARNLTISKLGIDATAKFRERTEGWAFASVPDQAASSARDVLRAAGIAPAQSRLLQGIDVTAGSWPASADVILRET